MSRSPPPCAAQRARMRANQECTVQETAVTEIEPNLVARSLERAPRARDRVAETSHSDAQVLCATALPRKRTVPSMVRFTPEEFALVLERALACGRPPAVYIREAALGAAPKSKRTPERAAMVRELVRLGNLLTTLISADGSTDRRTEEALTEVLEAVRRLG